MLVKKIKHAKMVIRHGILKFKARKEYACFLTGLNENPYTALFTVESCQIMNKQFGESPEYGRNRADLFDVLFSEIEKCENGARVIALAEYLGRLWDYWLEVNDCGEVTLYTSSTMRFLFDIAEVYEYDSPMFEELFTKIQTKCMGYNFWIAIPTLIEILKISVLDGFGIEVLGDEQEVITPGNETIN